jgi:hypothetical protein
VLVKLLGILVGRMNEQCANPGALRYGNSAIHRILQHGCAQLDTLRPAIYSQPTKHHDGNWIRHIPANPAGRQLVRNCSSSHGVEATHPVFFINDHKRSAGSVVLVTHRPAFEPVVQGVFAAFEIVQQVHAGKRLRRRQLQAHALLLSHGAFTAISRARPSLALGGASSMAVNCWNFSASRPKKT